MIDARTFIIIMKSQFPSDELFRTITITRSIISRPHLIASLSHTLQNKISFRRTDTNHLPSAMNDKQKERLSISMILQILSYVSLSCCLGNYPVPRSYPTLGDSNRCGHLFRIKSRSIRLFPAKRTRSTEAFEVRRCSL